MFIPPMLLPEEASPSVENCSLISEYVEQLIRKLNTAINELKAVSSDPDESQSVLIQKAEQMRTDANNLKRNLISIKNQASTRKNYQISRRQISY